MSKGQTKTTPAYQFLPSNWWILQLQAAQIAHDSRKLLVALAGLLMLMGLGDVVRLPEAADNPPPTLLAPALPDVLADPVVAWKRSVQHTNDLWLIPVQSVRLVLQSDVGWLEWGKTLLQALATILVLVFMGGAIGRIAAHDLTGRPRPKMLEALRFSLKHLKTLFGAPLAPSLCIGILGLLCAFFGLFFRLPAPYGTWIGGVLTVFPLILAIPMGLLVLGVALAWPLMVMTVAAESEDIYDTLSRSFSYLYRRLGRFLVLVAFAWLIGSVGWLIAVSVARLVLSLGVWGMSLGGPGSLIRDLFTGTSDDTAGLVPRFWKEGVRLLAYAWIFSYFWCAVAAIYVILRRDVDGTPYESLDGAMAENPLAPPWLTPVSDVGQTPSDVSSV